MNHCLSLQLGWNDVGGASGYALYKQWRGTSVSYCCMSEMVACALRKFDSCLPLHYRLP